MGILNCVARLETNWASAVLAWPRVWWSRWMMWRDKSGRFFRRRSSATLSAPPLTATAQRPRGTVAAVGITRVVYMEKAHGDAVGFMVLMIFGRMELVARRRRISNPPAAERIKAADAGSGTDVGANATPEKAVLPVAVASVTGVPKRRRSDRRCRRSGCCQRPSLLRGAGDGVEADGIAAHRAGQADVRTWREYGRRTKLIR